MNPNESDPPSTGSGQAEFRAAFDRVADWIDAYYRDGRRYPVLSRARPGDLVETVSA